MILVQFLLVITTVTMKNVIQKKDAMLLLAQQNIQSVRRRWLRSGATKVLVEGFGLPGAMCSVCGEKANVRCV